MAEPNNTPRPLSPAPAGTETTPLLPSGYHESSAQPQVAGEGTLLPLAGTQNVTALVSGPRMVRSIKALTYVSLVASTICLVMLLASYITCELSPLAQTYDVLEAEAFMGALGVAVCSPCCPKFLMFAMPNPLSPSPSFPSYI